ncbi:hypothetical protein BH09CHL1_BH09CHL1_00600 [soil metagenome]
MNITNRLSRSFVACLMALMVFGQLLTGAPGISAADGPAADFAALAVRPSDLDEPGFGRFSGLACAGAAGCAETIFPNGGPDEATLKAAKVRRGYYAGLSEPEEINLGNLADTIETTILEFADSSKAKAGLELLLGELAAQATPTASEVAPGAQLLVTSNPNAGSNEFDGEAAVRFRSGRLVISIDRHFVGSEIDGASVETLAGIMLDRIENGVASPHLGSLMVHHVAGTYDAYDLIDGEIQPTYYGFGSIDQERADEYEAAGAVDVYISAQDLIRDMMGYSTVAVTITLAQFETDADAVGFIQHSIDRVTNVGATVRDIEGAEELGDTSAAIIILFGSTYTVQYIVQVGSMAMTISWDNYLPSSGSLEDQVVEAQALFAPIAQFSAQQQTECVETGSCPSLVEIPADLIPTI